MAILRSGTGAKTEDPGADHDPGLSLPNPQPLVESLTLREAAVENGHLQTEPAPELIRDLGGQSDFGHQHQGASTGSNHQGNGVEIDLRLSASRDSMDEHAVKAAVGQPPSDHFQDPALIRIQRMPRDRRGRVRIKPRRAVDALRFQHQGAPSRQRFQRAVAGAGLPHESGDRYRELPGGQQSQKLPLPRRQIGAPGGIDAPNRHPGFDRPRPGDRRGGLRQQARGKHALQHLTQGGEIIARHPLAETQQLGRKDGIRIQNPLQILQLQIGVRRRTGDDDADQLPAAEGDQDPGAGGRQRLHPIRDPVGELLEEREGDRNLDAPVSLRVSAGGEVEVSGHEKLGLVRHVQSGPALIRPRPIPGGDRADYRGPGV